MWPAATKPAWYPPSWAELSKHGILESAYQAEFTKMSSSGYRQVWVDGFDVGGQTYFNVIFRPANGTAWVAKHGLTGTEYQTEFNLRTSLGYRLLQVDSYLSGGSVRYAAIFVKNTGGVVWTAYHGLTCAQHQQKFNSLTGSDIGR